MAGFLETTGSVPQNYDPDGTRTMGYYNQQDLPYYYDLATFFATSDSWHSPILANTVPNRMYMMAAPSFGHEYPDFSSNHPKYSAPTIFRAMNAANVSWLYYYKDGIFLANFLDFQDAKIGPKTFPVIARGRRLIRGRYELLDADLVGMSAQLSYGAVARRAVVGVRGEWRHIIV
jgi:phosphoesterase family protein